MWKGHKILKNNKWILIEQDKLRRFRREEDSTVLKQQNKATIVSCLIFGVANCDDIIWAAMTNVIQ